MLIKCTNIVYKFNNLIIFHLCSASTLAASYECLGALLGWLLLLLLLDHFSGSCLFHL